jgi:hypothetical protein
MKRARKGQREGMVFCMSLGSLPGVGSKAMVDHFRLVGLQACGEGESGATSKILEKKRAGLPLPTKREARPISIIGTAPYLPLANPVVLPDLVSIVVFKLVAIPGII